MPNNDYNIDDLLNEEFPEDIDNYEPLNKESLSKNIKLLSPIGICDLLLTIKTFGMGKDLEIICMKELVNKRINGDNFDYEEYIKNHPVEKIKVKHNNVDLSTIINMVRK
jgi:hypothetical protein